MKKVQARLVQRLEDAREQAEDRPGDGRVPWRIDALGARRHEDSSQCADESSDRVSSTFRARDRGVGEKSGRALTVANIRFHPASGLGFQLRFLGDCSFFVHPFLLLLLVQLLANLNLFQDSVAYTIQFFSASDSRFDVLLGTFSLRVDLIEHLVKALIQLLRARGRGLLEGVGGYDALEVLRAYHRGGHHRRPRRKPPPCGGLVHAWLAQNEAAPEGAVLLEVFRQV
mmetsp:Transcript_43170/g.123047  ORF Transcript_43170/g.123047 Transcript_43170/m.123047 type:complete len:228 (-) Transcript_43170:287-970(-)